MSPAPSHRPLLFSSLARPRARFDARGFARAPEGAFRPAATYLTVVALTASCFVSEAARAEEALSQATMVEAPSERRIAVVREEDVASEDLAELDRELISVLAAREDLPAAQFSPVPFSELALTAECNGGTADCLQRVARRLEHPWLVLRIVDHDSSGNSRLTLMAPDPFIAGVTRQVSGEVSSFASSLRSRSEGRASTRDELTRLLSLLYPRTMVRPVPLGPQAAATLFPSTKVAQPRAPQREGRALGRASKNRRIAGYSLLGTSVALLVSGSIVGGLAVRDRNTYEGLELRSAADVDRAAELRDRYEDRTGWARGLWAGAAVSGALGASLMLWDRLTERNHASVLRSRFDRAFGMRLAATPVAGGAGIWLSGRLQRSAQ